MPHRYVVGLGANLGDPPAAFAAALSAIGEFVAVSRLYASAPVGGPEQPDFLNAAALVETAREPERLLADLLEIEAGLGRVRTVRWGPRTIDLDLLWWSGGAHRSPALELPHPRLHERSFALLPLLDVLPDDAPERAGLAAAARALDQPIRRLETLAAVTIDVTTTNEG
jgi:2-amino-4-hydroxy-6-hydroxymethyldihydropteridine diphosphokinase